MDNYYIARCIELARLGAGHVSPNPMVGALLVHEDRIIGEGFHEKYGEAHAEVNCIRSVSEKDKNRVSQSVLYISLEPCAHYGKTPPCTELIIKNKIPRVVIGCRDPFKEVNGKGIEKLKSAGIDVKLVEGDWAAACENLNKRFFCFHLKERPYIILKWAQTADGFMASVHPQANEKVRERLLISNEYSNRLVHKWRSEEAAILVGTNTAMMDDPELTNRFWAAPSPIRLVVDMGRRLPASLKLFSDAVSTIVFNGSTHTLPGKDPGGMIRSQKGTWYYKLNKEGSLPGQIVEALYGLKIDSIFIEGGKTLLQSFIDEGLWDECRIITSTSVRVKEGLPAPGIQHAGKLESVSLLDDKIDIYVNKTLAIL